MSVSVAEAANHRMPNLPHRPPVLVDTPGLLRPTAALRSVLRFRRSIGRGFVSGKLFKNGSSAAAGATPSAGAISMTGSDICF
jgi:hypothetical protein